MPKKKRRKPRRPDARATARSSGRQSPKPAQRALSAALIDTMRQAQTAFRAGNMAGAAELLRPHAAAERDNPNFLYLLATIEAELGQWADAERHIRRGLKIAPNDRRLLTRLARAHVVRGDLDAAHEAIDRAIATDPAESRPVSVKAELLFTAGRVAEARELLLEAMETRRPIFPLAIILAETAMSTGEHAEALEAVLPFRDDPSIPPLARRTMLFRIARLHEKLGQYDEAFFAARDANELRKRRYDPDAYDRSIEKMIEAWTPGVGPISTNTNSRMVLIVAMPRSGTSLLEQMLDCHEGVRGAGELPFFRTATRRLGLSDVAMFNHVHHPERLSTEQLDTLASEYLKQAEVAGDDGPLVIDKDPTNFEHVGLIAKMLPNAKIIHCLRDPMDNGVSCYFQDFTDVIPYGGDLRNLGRAYRAQERLMDHWKRALDIPIHTVVYEELASRTEPVMRAILDFLDLPFDPACCAPQKNTRVVFTPSNQQVRQSVNTKSVGRAERMAAHLGPLREGLGLD